MKQLEKLLFLTYFQMRSKYRKTLAGFVWVIAYPIISFIIQATVFDKILKLNIQNYPLFLLSGLLPWVFISQSVTSFASSLVHSREVLLTFKVHPNYIIGANVLDNFFNYLVATLILIVALMGLGMMSFSLPQLVLFLLSTLVLLVFGFVLTMIISFLHVFYRDIQFVSTFLLGLAFFVTPIFYSRDYLEASFPWILKINLFYPLIALFQNSLYELNTEAWLNYMGISVAIVTGLGLMLAFLFNRKMKDFYINV